MPEPYYQLKQHLANGEVNAFAGAGLSAGAGLPDWYALISELASRIGYEMPPRQWATGDALIDAAQAYVNREGLHGLISHLKDRFATTAVQPTAAHRALARLPISLVFTANFDDLLERAFREAGKRVEVVVRDSSIPFMRRGPNTVNIVKLYGDLDQPDTIVLARQQYESYFLQRPQMVKLLEVELSRSDTLYLGWSGSDPYFKLVFGELLSRFGEMMRPGYAVMFDVTADQRAELARKRIHLVEPRPDVDRTEGIAEWLQSLQPPDDPDRSRKGPRHVPCDASFSRYLISEMIRGEDNRSRAFAYLAELEPGSEGPCHEVIRDGLLKTLQSDTEALHKRTQAGNCLACLGDPRFRPDAWFLPNDRSLGFVEIPAGEFFMGEATTGNRPTNGRERLQHACTLPAYLLARYPVTVAQFSAFLEETSYGRDRGLRPKGLSNHPVVGVTWHDALAYCEWLTAKLLESPDTPRHINRLLKQEDGAVSWSITLPSEAEWEKAARGMVDARPYPWGIMAPGPELANFSGTDLGATCTVGSFPRGRSPYGVEDMSGNVWEWTRTIWGSDLDSPEYKYPYSALDGRERLQADHRFLRVLRGGSLYSADKDLRCTSYCLEDPSLGHPHIGFRLAISSNCANSQH